jgi:glycosyltransferase involved in cell wall biosynthesis
MNIAVFTPLNRLVIPSGVPRHIIEIVGRLLRDHTVRVSFFANRAEAEKYLSTQGRLWADAPRVTFEPPTSVMVRRWGIFNRPSFERMGGEADWLYLPADGYVPVERAKLAVTIHDVYKLEPPARGENRLEHYRARLRHWVFYKRAAARADRIITVSQFSADRIMHHLGVPATRIQVVPNGVSEAFFKPDLSLWPLIRGRLGLAVDEPFFVYAGGLKAKKNGRGIIAGWAEFERRQSAGRLIILGHHEAAMLERAKRSLQRSVFPERLTDAELAVTLAHSTGLLFPSFYEGFGIPVVEAMAAGTLTVVSDIPVLRELAGEPGIYVDPHKAHSIAEGLLQALNCVNERPNRIAAGRVLAARYSWVAAAQWVKDALS